MKIIIKKGKPDTNWPFQLKRLEVKEGGEIFAEAEFPAVSQWFDGHFPEKPILPGVAQLHMVVSILSTVENKKFCIQEIKRIRYRQSIGPHDVLMIHIYSIEGNVYNFRLDRDGETACSGTMMLTTVDK